MNSPSHGTDRLQAEAQCMCPLLREKAARADFLRSRARTSIQRRNEEVRSGVSGGRPGCKTV